MKEIVEDFPSGKKIIRRFDDDGRPVSETHRYGLLDIVLTRDVRTCGTMEETYIVKGRLVSRARYEKVRADFPDMPAADTSLFDISGALVQGIREERRQRRKAAKAHQPNLNLDEGAKRDAFCRDMMLQGQREEAASWIASPKNTIGELSHAASRRLVNKLAQLGCKQVIACQIDNYDDNLGNTGHLVVELPDEVEGRKRVFREINRLAAKQGFSGEIDDGQRHAYLKLD